MRSTRLLSPDQFADVFEPLLPSRVGYVRPYGNVGDKLIESATLQLFAEFGVRWKYQSHEGPLEPRVDHLVYGGGGNMGTFYRDNWEQRGQALRLGLPMTILPQTFTSAEDRDYARIYVRERDSLRLCPTATLAPDLALGLVWKRSTPPTKDLGVFLRGDVESAVNRRWWSRDPARMCRTPEAYLNLAASYRRLVTDRLHFAICGLIAGRDVALLPNSYYKNRAMHATWLEDLGCRFAASVSEAVAALTVTNRSHSLFWRLAG